jgi:hypothetical protein
VNMFNRLAMIIILLTTSLATVVGILLLLLAPGSLAPLFNNLGTRMVLSRSDSRLTELQFEVTIVALIVFVPAVVLLLLEVRRTTRDSIRISQITGGEAHLSTQAVAQSLIYYVDALPGVVRVRPRLAAKSQTINVRLDVETTPDVDVRSKTEEITRTARSVIEEKLGLKLRHLYIHIHHSPLARNAPPPPLQPATVSQAVSLEPLQPAPASQTVRLEPLQQPARTDSREPAVRTMLPEPPPVPASEATPHADSGETKNPSSG